MDVETLVGLGRAPYTGFWGHLSVRDKDAVNNAISLAGIEPLRYRMVQSLSDGERQKVMIAKAFAQETPVIFLDEPTAFLDYPSKVEIMLLLYSFAHKMEKTIFEPLFKNHVHDNRNTDKRSHTIQWKYYVIRQNTYKIANQAYHPARKNASGNNHAMISNAEDHPDHVRHGKSDERHRSAECRDHGGQQPGCDQQEIAHGLHAYAEIERIVLSKQYHIQRLHLPLNGVTPLIGVPVIMYVIFKERFKRR